MSDDAASSKAIYAYKPSLTGSARYFELTEEGLSFRSGYRAGVWSYRDITCIRLSHRPVSMLAHRFRADIQNASGKSLSLISATWTSIAMISPQDDAYRAFLQELHARVAAAGGYTIYAAGLKPIPFAFASVALAVVMLAIAGLLVRAIATGAMMAAIFMLGFAAWFGWSIGRWLVRNKPGGYDPAHLPTNLLP